MEKSRTLAPFQTNMKFDFLVHQKKNVINEFVPNERKKTGCCSLVKVHYIVY